MLGGTTTSCSLFHLEEIFFSQSEQLGFCMCWVSQESLHSSGVCLSRGESCRWAPEQPAVPLACRSRLPVLCKSTDGKSSDDPQQPWNTSVGEESGAGQRTLARQGFWGLGSKLGAAFTGLPNCREQPVWAWLEKTLLRSDGQRCWTVLLLASEPFWCGAATPPFQLDVLRFRGGGESGCRRAEGAFRGALEMCGWVLPRAGQRLCFSMVVLKG